MDKYAGYKTFAFNALMGLSLLLKGFFPDSEAADEGALRGLVELFFASWDSIIVLGNLVLRAYSNSPVFWKKSA